MATRKQAELMTLSMVIETLKSVGIITHEMETGFDGLNISVGEFHFTSKTNGQLFSRKELNNSIGYWLSNKESL